MPFVGAERLGYAYSDRVRLLEDVCFHLSPGWYGLVGANGMGKTTLARLIAGELAPTAGRIWLEPEGAKVILCRQEVSVPTEDLLQFVARSDRDSCRQRGLLGLKPGELGRWETLSPGERKRWQLAAALAESPDVLIVDEPTNHLDGEGRAYLLDALRRFSGVGLAISHDREFLGALTESTLRLHEGRVDSYPASYAGARRLWEGAVAAAKERRDGLVSRKKRVERRLVTARHDQEAAQRKRSAGSRMKNAHDHDGSSFAMTERASGGEASISRRLSIMSGELTRLEQSIPEFQVDKTLGRSVFLGYQPAPKPQLLGLHGEELRVGERVLLRDVRVTLTRDARVHLRGPNGAGKTTLLLALLARAGTALKHILYLPQELGAERTRELRTATVELPRTERGRLLSLLAALGVAPERILDSEALSPGEARKLALAYGLARHAWALVLDEPTNHLDLPSIERLEAALAAYPGALLIVSHDASFAAACTKQAWTLCDGWVET